MSQSTGTFDASVVGFFRNSEFSTPLFEASFRNPWRIPFFVEINQRAIEEAADQPAESVSHLASMLGSGNRRSLLGNPIKASQDFAVKPGSLRAILQRLENEKLITSPPVGVEKLPIVVQQAAALTLHSIYSSRNARRAAFANAGDIDRIIQRVGINLFDSDDPLDTLDNLKIIRSVDHKYLYAGGHDVVAASVEASGMLSAVPENSKYRFEVRSAWGRIIFSGGTDDVYDGQNTLLIIDTGGSDTYVNVPATKTAANWCSVVLDSAGSDRYISDPALATQELISWSGRKKRVGMGPGSAICGYSVIADTAGNDRYSSHLDGLGYSAFGVSVVFDRAGDDRYQGYRNALGAGFHGIGIVEDSSGDDKYWVLTQGQGFGGVQGAGLLFDHTGKDEYIAEDKVLDNPSDQSPEHNTSMAQGAGFGRRADYIDGHSLSGGIGILLDGSGDDSYSCGVFGQGVGYWEGFGALLDNSGNDKYLGQWYAQGASAHFAIGYLNDRLGNDVYRAPMNMAMGAGHDFSVGMLLDEFGDDNYAAPNLSLGAGNANGIGAFMDLAGNDFYASTGISLGMSSEAPKGTLRERALSFGLFVDLQGQDSYPVTATWAKNAERTTQWVDRRLNPQESQMGVFLDR